MPREPQPQPSPELTDEQIREIFTTLQLPTEPPHISTTTMQPLGPIVFYPVTGDSPPLSPR